MSSNFYTSSHCQHHLHTRSTLQASPGRSLDLQYCTPRQLYCLHIWFAGLIQKIGKRMHLKAVPLGTATVFFKRFYIKNAICETNPFLVLAACIFVAAKVEETPVHIKTVVAEARYIFSENNIQGFPPEANKLGEMEFYLLEDLDFHLVVFHPQRALLNMTGREPADGGRWPKTRLEEDTEIRMAEAERAKKVAQPGMGVGGLGRARSSSTASQTAGPAGSAGSPGVAHGAEGREEEGESEEARITRLMSRGSGEGLMEIDDSTLQKCFFVITDSYRTDVSLLYPPYIIALSAMYIGMVMNAVQDAAVKASANASASSGVAPRTRQATSTTTTQAISSQTTSVADAVITNAALGLPPPPGAGGDTNGIPPVQGYAGGVNVGPQSRSHLGVSAPGYGRSTSSATQSVHPSSSRAADATRSADPHSTLKPNEKPLLPGAITAAAFLSTFNVSLPVLFACVQDLVALYPIWEGFEPTPLPVGAPAATAMNSAAAAAAAGGTRRMFDGSLAFSSAAPGQGPGPGVGVGVGVSVGGATAALHMRHAANVAGGLAGRGGQSQGGSGNGTGNGNGSENAQQQQPFGPREADALVRKMIEERARDEAHPDNVSSAGSTGTHTTLGEDLGLMKKGQAVATAQIAGKKRRV